MEVSTDDIDIVSLAEQKSGTTSDSESHYTKVEEQRPEPPVRGEKILRVVDRWFHRLDQWVEQYIPSHLNPFTQSGAIANTTFIIALVSGFILLFWYKPSVYMAYESLAQLPFLGEFMRALHRYSSDACMLFIFFHAAKMFFARRFGGARVLAWITGIVAVALLWFDGWLGYWLVWDERANQIAVGTAKMLDQLPIFAEPLTRSFLTDESFNSLLFFLVFFFHMLIPLAMGVALWLHVSRLNKSHFITGKTMTWYVIGTLSLMSIILPADLTEPAKMLEVQQSMPVDYYYMLPVYFTDRLEGGALWLITLISSIGFISIPWLLVKRQPPKPKVDQNYCNGCEQCYLDCPYNAITMLPRAKDDKKRGDFFASIDPAKCVACGICVGSCDPVGIEFPRLPANDVRREIDQWLEQTLMQKSDVRVAFICSNSAGADLHVDEQTGWCKELPGYVVRSLPCVGWVHPLMIERSLRKGAEGVLVVGCQSEPDYRLGAMWTDKRLGGKRHPELREDKVDPDRIHYVQYDRTRYDDFIDEARAFQRNSSTFDYSEANGYNFKTWFTVAVIILMIGSLTYFFSKAPYQVPVKNQSELVVSFNLAGRPITTSVKDASSQANLQSHMRRDDLPVERKRSSVRMKIVVDGQSILEKKYQPKGLFNDGTSGAIEYLPLEAGTHEIELYLGDETDELWRYKEKQKIDVANHKRTVVTFNRKDGFQWFGIEGREIE